MSYHCVKNKSHYVTAKILSYHFQGEKLQRAWEWVCNSTLKNLERVQTVQRWGQPDFPSVLQQTKFPGQIPALKEMKENQTSPSAIWWNIVFQWTPCFSEWQNCFSKLGGIPLQTCTPAQTSSLAWNHFLHSSCREGLRSLTVLMQDQKVWGAWGHEDHLKQKRTL